MTTSYLPYEPGQSRLLPDALQEAAGKASCHFIGAAAQLPQLGGGGHPGISLIYSQPSGDGNLLTGQKRPKSNIGMKTSDHIEYWLHY